MINGITLRDAILSGANNICKSKKSVDELNIFPVPDGDTGTNMSMTMTAAIRELEKDEDPSAGNVAHRAASAMLRPVQIWSTLWDWAWTPLIKRS